MLGGIDIFVSTKALSLSLCDATVWTQCSLSFYDIVWTAARLFIRMRMTPRGVGDLTSPYTESRTVLKAFISMVQKTSKRENNGLEKKYDIVFCTPHAGPMCGRCCRFPWQREFRRSVGADLRVVRLRCEPNELHRKLCRARWNSSNS